MHVDNLPAEIRSYIFLEIHNDELNIANRAMSPTLLQCSLVCKSWLAHCRWLAFSRLKTLAALPAEARYYTNVLPLKANTLTGGTLLPYVQEVHFMGPYQAPLRSGLNRHRVAYRQFNVLLRNAAHSLEGLRRISFSHVEWTRLSGKTVELVGENLARNVTWLKLSDVTFRDVQCLAKFIARFPILRQLTVEAVTFKQRIMDSGSLLPLPPHLEALSLQMAPELRPWLTGVLATRPCQIDELQVTNISTREDYDVVAQLIEKVGPKLRNLSVDMPYLSHHTPDCLEEYIPLPCLDSAANLKQLSIRGLPSNPTIAPTISALEKTLLSLRMAPKVLTLGFVINETSENQYRQERSEWNKLDSVLLEMHKAGLASIQIALLVRPYRAMPGGVYGPFVPLMRGLLPGIEKEGLLKVVASSFRM